jgi:F-type H+-transporting ATPase subunit gamma
VSSLKGVERHLDSLGDIRAIMNSMKSLAYMESTKLGQLLPAQHAVTQQIEIAAFDLLAFHPEVLPDADAEETVWILIGTERGFCGNLNQRLVERLDAGCPPSAKVLAVGHKLHAVMKSRGPDKEQPILIDGAGVADEMSDVLNRIVSELDTLQQDGGPLAVSVMYFDAHGQLASRDLLPPFRHCPTSPAAHSSPPQLNDLPARVLLDLGDQFLFSALFEVLYESLLNESVHRVNHLGDAIRYLDKQMMQLSHRANALRQEMITEEIEVLLLSVR